MGWGEMVVVVSVVARSRRPFRFQGRSFLAFVLTPEGPVPDWLEALDAWAAGTPDFFAKRPIILNLVRLALTKPELAGLLAELQTRQFRLIGVEGVDPDWLGPSLAPLPGGKPTLWDCDDTPAEDEATEPAEPVDSQTEPASLLLDAPVRSGQSVFFPNGDVTVMGSVASGAEVIAGGSVHIYGALRGKAYAGSNGRTSARIFCRRFEAELVVVGGYYMGADDFGPGLQGKPVQVRLEGSAILISAMAER
jgi:septum site-determining protein MinC